MMLRRASIFAACAALAACASGEKWVSEIPASHGGTSVEDAWRSPDPSMNAAPPEVRDPAGGPRASAGGPGVVPIVTATGELFRNTYYDFPREGAGDKTATIYDAACAPIAKVTVDFHDRVCVQGSGRLADGQTVSFAKRDCACAAVCPRTSQKICYERLDPARFPHGRGATGGPITPMRTVAVDVSVIPLGTPIYIPEMRGLPLPDGSEHDGCFIAEDRGLKVVGRHLDIFTGDPALTTRWNRIVPSNQGVHAHLGDARCVRR